MGGFGCGTSNACKCGSINRNQYRTDAGRRQRLGSGNRGLSGFGCGADCNCAKRKTFGLGSVGYDGRYSVNGSYFMNGLGLDDSQDPVTSIVPTTIDLEKYFNIDPSVWDAISSPEGIAYSWDRGNANIASGNNVISGGISSVVDATGSAISSATAPVAKAAMNMGILLVGGVILVGIVALKSSK